MGTRGDAAAVLVRNPGLKAARLVFIHGSGDGPSRWAAGVAGSRGGLALDWEAEASNKLSAPERGYALGRELAPFLEPGDRTIYAHSAGAWLAQGLVEGLAVRPGAGRVDLVLLDPFTTLSLVRPFAGGRLLGQQASSVRTFYTTLDPIPFTAGRVAAGTRTAVGVPDLAATGSEAHWALVDWYFSNHDD